jgi:hypothetical protein
MNPQDLINQNIRMLIGDLQVNLMVANARVQELEAQLSAAMEHPAFKQAEEPVPEVSKPNGKGKEAAQP